MAACKNLLCVNSFTEANQRHALAASKQIGRANDKAEGGFLSFFLSFHLALCACVWSTGWMKAAVTPWDFTENTPTKKAKDKRGTQSSRVHKLIKKIRMSSDFTSLPFSVLVLSNTFSSVIFTLCNISQSSRVWLFSRPRYNHSHNEWLMMAVSSFWQQEQNAYFLSFMCFHSRSKWDFFRKNS